jgi:peptidyl-dipeptidase Dcp
MAENAANVYQLMDQLLDAYMEPARKELKEIEDMARKVEGDDFKLQPWDFSYYGHKLKMERYNIDAEMLRPYLELSRVKAGVFSLATRLYGITFRENKDIPVYHPDVQAFEVLDKDGSFLAVLYTDFHPRKG